MTKKHGKKVPYTQPSKRNLMQDIRTVAGRRAKARSVEKMASNKLRAALGNPIDKKGKPLPGHIVTTMAASHIFSSPGQSVVNDFEATADMFLGKLTYLPSSSVSISHLWK